MYRLKIQTVLFQCSGYVILNENITLGSELVQDLYTSWILKRQGQRLFVPVDLFLSVPRSLTDETCQRSHLENTPLHPVHCAQHLPYILHTEDPMLSCRHHELGALS